MCIVVVGGHGIPADLPENTRRYRVGSESHIEPPKIAERDMTGNSSALRLSGHGGPGSAASGTCGISRSTPKFVASRSSSFSSEIILRIRPRKPTTHRIACVLLLSSVSSCKVVTKDPPIQEKPTLHMFLLSFESQRLQSCYKRSSHPRKLETNTGTSHVATIFCNQLAITL